MQQRDGLFITIEGTDGSGKDTQAALLQQHLERAGYEVVQLNFPRHGKPAAYFVDQYRQGAYGSSLQVGAYTACLFYALDYYDAAPTIRKALAEGKAVVAARFGASNMANQGAKISHPEERRGFFIWLDNLQYRMLNVPRPSLSFVLRVPPSVAQERVRQKRDQAAGQRTEAAQLAELDQLQLAANVYDDMCQLFPKDFLRVDCARASTLLEPQQIHDLIWGKVAPLVPEPEPEPAPAVTKPQAAAPAAAQPPKTTTMSLLAAVHSNVPQMTFTLNQQMPTLYTPPHLDGKTNETYRQQMTRLLKLHAHMAAKLQGGAQAGVIRDLQLVLPAATIVTVTGDITAAEIAPAKQPTTQFTLAAVAAELHKNYSDESATLRLTNYWPRNELDIVPAILYEYSNQSFSDIQRIVAEWPYDKKSFVLRSYIEHPDLEARALKSVLYSWDVLAEFQAIVDLRSLAVTGLDWQPLSPRLGYDVPLLIEQAGLTDDFERCFDLSLELYSTLQAAGYAEEAQYAVLLGHRVRAKLTVSASDLLHLRALTADTTEHPAAGRLVTSLLSQVASAHPLVASALQPAKSAPAKAAKPTSSASRPKPQPKRSGTKPPLDK